MEIGSASSTVNGLISSSSSDLSDDASSPNNGPLYDLADLMAQLPIKRGLYNGKSQTFASLSDVRSVEDVGKREMSLSRRMKSCRSYGGNLVIIQHKFGPKPTIAKSSPKTPSFSAKPTFIHG